MRCFCLRYRPPHLKARVSCQAAAKHCQPKPVQRKVSTAATSTQQRQEGAKSAEVEDDKKGFSDFEPPPVLPGAQLQLDDLDLEEGPDDPSFEYHEQDVRSAGGYTPFETLDFSNDDITHEVTIRVDAPRSKCYQIWLDRLNYLEWFDITQVWRSACSACQCSAFLSWRSLYNIRVSAL